MQVNDLFYWQEKGEGGREREGERERGGGGNRITDCVITTKTFSNNLCLAHTPSQMTSAPIKRPHIHLSEN